MIIIKIGGGDGINLAGIVADLSRLEEQYVLVHGANALRDHLLNLLGMQKQVITSLSGYSSVFTDQDALDILIMAYAGLRNKRLVELCQRQGINAVGLSGLDGRVIQGTRNKGIRIKDKGKLRIVHDFSGKPKQINRELIHLLLEHGYVPVLTVPILDENGYAINSENDDITALLQETLHADTVIHLIEAPGFLSGSDDHSTLISKMNQKELESWESRAEGRIRRKLLAIRKLFENGACSVIISDGRAEHPVRDALDGKGTVVR